MGASKKPVFTAGWKSINTVFYEFPYKIYKCFGTTEQRDYGEKETFEPGPRYKSVY